MIIIILDYMTVQLYENRYARLHTITWDKNYKDSLCYSSNYVQL